MAVNSNEELNWLSNGSFTPLSTEEARRLEPTTQDEEPIINAAHAELKIYHGCQKEYYIDKKRAHNKTITTIAYPGRPRYKVNPLYLTYNAKKSKQKKKPSKERYFNTRIKPDEYTFEGQMDNGEHVDSWIVRMFTKTLDTPEDLDNWIKFTELNKMNHHKLSNYALYQRQLSITEKALKHHPDSTELLNLYIEAISNTLTPSEVSNALNIRTTRDPYNYTLWTAYIMADQGTMARCNTPTVLSTYELCIQTLRRGATKKMDANVSATLDSLMLKLQFNLALFVRQSGCLELFHALLKFALEINAPDSTFGCFAPSADNERTLVEYEELILKSGLPLSEIWMRIEKLRQAHCFLPLPESCTNNLDPERIVYAEQVAELIYPYEDADRQLFNLVLNIIYLVKVPFVHSHCLSKRLLPAAVAIDANDEVEMFIANATHRISYALPMQKENKFISALYATVRHMATNPTYLNAMVGAELYTNFINKLLLDCAEIFAHASTPDAEQRRRALLLIWLRFERTRLNFAQLSGEISKEFLSAARARIKAQLGKPKNAADIALFTEFAIYNYEAATAMANTADDNEQQQAYSVFELIINLCKNQPYDMEDQALNYAYVCYAELLISRLKLRKASHILICMALGKHAVDNELACAPKMLAAEQRLLRRIEEEIITERNACQQQLPLEAYFMPNKLIILLRARNLLLALNGEQHAAFAYNESLLSAEFMSHKTERTHWLREQIYELYVSIFQLPVHANEHIVSVNQQRYIDVLQCALDKCPRNLCLLQRWCMLSRLPWYKLRMQMLSFDELSMLHVVYLIAATRYRFLDMLDTSVTSDTSAMQHDSAYLQRIVNNFILAIFTGLQANNFQSAPKQAKQFELLKRNALFWRFYLHYLSMLFASFTKLKEVFLIAIDTCPWSKALYMDGAFYIPTELPQVQDMLIEKEFRVYAQPEELEALRSTI